MSIYELIHNSIQDGVLPERFCLPAEGAERLPFADGAKDGISVFHVQFEGLQEGDRKLLASIFAAIREERREEADALVHRLTEGVLVLQIVDEIQQYVIDRKEELEADILQQYAVHLVVSSAYRESVKFGMTLLSLLPQTEVLKDILRELGLCNEFTIFTIFIMHNWEDAQGEIFELTKKVHGWGKIHAVGYLDEANPAVRNWILKEGVKNTVLPAYLGRTCYRKADVESLLEEELDGEEVSAVLRIIDAMLDEGPVIGISALEDPADCLSKVLRHALKMEAPEAEDYLTVKKIADWLEDNDYGQEEAASFAGAVLADEKCRRTVERQVEKGCYIELAQKLGLPYKETVYRLIAEEFETRSDLCRFLKEDGEYMAMLALLFEERLPLSGMAGEPSAEWGLTEEFADYHRLDAILSLLEKHPGVGYPLVQTGLQSPVVKTRFCAVNALAGWCRETGEKVEECWPEAAALLAVLAEKEPVDRIRQIVFSIE